MRKEYIFFIPRGALKRNYCSNCGERLTKEKVHRIEHDKSYMGNRTIVGTNGVTIRRRIYPQKVDTHITEHQFKCPNCLNRYGSEDQSIISIIQKNRKQKTLSPEEIRSEYHSALSKYHRRGNVRFFIFSFIIAAIAFLIGCIDLEYQSFAITPRAGFISALFWFFSVVGFFSSKNRFRSPEYGLILNKLYAMSFNNKKLISNDTVCHCFKCRSKFDGGEIKRYDTDGVSALCPSCGTRAVIMENADVEITDDTVMEMHYHWCREPRF